MPQKNVATQLVSIPKTTQNLLTFHQNTEKDALPLSLACVVQKWFSDAKNCNFKNKLSGKEYFRRAVLLRGRKCFGVILKL